MGVALAAARQAQRIGRQAPRVGRAPGAEHDHEPEQQPQVLRREAVLDL